MPTYNGTAANDVIAGDQAGIDDDVINGLAGNDVLSGLDGSDTLSGGAGADSLDGGNGDDLVDGGSGTTADMLSGGDGIDTLTYASATVRVVVRLGVATAQSTYGAGNDTLSGFENLIGSAYNDMLWGTAGANQISGAAGNDAIDGGDGDDLIGGGAGTDIASYASAATGVAVSLLLAGAAQATGAGSDTLVSIEGLAGSAFDDLLTGDGGANTLSGAAGDDRLAGGAGNDLLDGGVGVDTASYADAGAAVTVNLVSQSAQNTGGGGTDTLKSIENVIATAFADTLTGNLYANVLTGGDGNDLLNGGLGNDTLDGGAGIDTASYAGAASGARVSLAIAGFQSTLSAGTDMLIGIENLTGSAYDDQLTGDAGANILTGNAGNDLLADSGGDDTLSGGAGIDGVSYAPATAAVTVNLALTTAQDTIGAGVDTLSSIENLTGSAFDDRLTGSVQANLIYGGAGNDMLEGANGADTLDGGTGNDLLKGGLADDVLIGGAGNDTLDGGVGTNLIDGGAGFDTISYAAAGAAVTVSLALTTPQTIAANSSTDTILNVEHLVGSNFGDTLSAGPLAATLDGGDGDDMLNGGAGNDMLNGGLRYDTINGGDGNDVIDGGLDHDRLNGGAGDDLLYGGDGSDQMDGGTGHDRLYGGNGEDQLKGGIDDLLVGGAGNDNYTIDDPGTTIVEAVDGGIDTVNARFDYVLPNTLENLYLYGTGNTPLTGTGNAHDNYLWGYGALTLYGGAGNDILVASDEFLDQLIGGVGDDLYQINGAAVVTEAANGGYDTVRITFTTSYNSYVLPENVEALQAIQYGSSYNVVIGNDLANRISGGGSVDGAGGADVLTIESSSGRYVFSATADSTPDAADRVTSLTYYQTIDLSLIDADTGTAGDQAFHKVASFTNTAGEYTVAYDGGTNITTLLGDTNGDGVAELGIQFDGNVLDLMENWVTWVL